MLITKDTKLADILKEYPWLKGEITKVNPKFKMLNTPIGKFMMKNATVLDMSEKSGMDVGVIILKLKELINSHN